MRFVNDNTCKVPSQGKGTGFCSVIASGTEGSLLTIGIVEVFEIK